MIAVELQAHGRTRDIDRPLSYEAMAGDMAALLRALDLERAQFVGYSLGGAVALKLASIVPSWSSAWSSRVASDCRGPGWRCSPAPPTRAWWTGSTGCPR